MKKQIPPWVSAVLMALLASLLAAYAFRQLSWT